MIPPQTDGDCAAAKTRLDALRCGELTPDEALALREHLEHCRDCQCLHHFEAAFLECLRRAGQQGGGCPDELRARIGALLTPPAV